ncbi:MAG: hypothetical protein A2521_08830 [Deltaproteobacteria bacterium RIFOXYD12_FULL_57_12]|nr:MAG: hypothetical protein A2521_08830 [Deltaproteobacteria bacterium RIFOXYD12_FULL_57_12]
MGVVAAEQELYRACHILFGPQLQVSREFLEYLQGTGIKSAYRQRVFETHPDLAGSDDDQLRRRRADLFRSVQQAREHLVTYLSAREKGFRFSSPFSTPATRADGPAVWQKDSAAAPEQKRPGDNGHAGFAGGAAGAGGCGMRVERAEWNIDALYQGDLPLRRLLLGHFMYYAGVISWRTIVQALVWQRMQRPRFGEIGCRLGLLTEADIRRFMKSRRNGQAFGKWAAGTGLLSERQVSLILVRQKSQQRRFGEYFLENDMLAPPVLAELLARYARHNAQFPSSCGMA